MLASDLFAPRAARVPVPTDHAGRPVPTITPVLLAQAVRVVDRRTVLWLAGILAIIAMRPWAPSWATTPFGLLSTVLPVVLTLYIEARKQLLQSLRDGAERAPGEQHYFFFFFFFFFPLRSRVRCTTSSRTGSA